jgi:hypothetical protein
MILKLNFCAINIHLAIYIYITCYIIQTKKYLFYVIILFSLNNKLSTASNSLHQNLVY